MNKERRGKLQVALNHLGQAAEIVEAVKEGEEEALSNMPDSFDRTDRWADMENAIDHMGDAIDDIKSAMEHVEEAQK